MTRNSSSPDPSGGEDGNGASARPDLASPPALQHLCMSALAERLEQICPTCTAGATDTPHPDGPYPPCFTVLRFPTPTGQAGSQDGAFLHTELAETLLRRLGESRRLSDRILTLFDARNTHLRSARLCHAGQVATPGLKSLRGHKLETLEVHGLTNATVTDLICCLNEWTIKNLRYVQLLWFEE